MKILLCILLLGYMIFGATPNPKNRPSAGKVTNGGRGSQFQNATKKQEMTSRVVFLDAKGNILDGSPELVSSR